MDRKKKLVQYGILLCVVLLMALLLPKGIRYLSDSIVERILSGNNFDETETEGFDESEYDSEATTETDIQGSDVTYSIGDPDLYVDKSDSTDQENRLKTQEPGSDPALAEKYEREAQAFEDYVNSFTPECREEEAGVMERFLSGNRKKFFETAAAYAFARWGDDRKITRLEFHTMSETDQKDGYICLVSFYHTSHPDTEYGDMAFCVYNRLDDTYSFT